MLLDAMHVAYRLGKDVEEIGDMTIERMSDWLAYFKYHDELRTQADIRACAIALAITTGRFKPEVILGDVPPAPQTPEEIKRRGMAWCRGNRGSITRRNSK